MTGDIMEARLETEARRRDLERQEKPQALSEEDKNSGFVQVYEKGWRRLQTLIQVSPAAAKIYAFLAEHIDGSTGSVVVSQTVLAEQLGVSEITVRRQTKFLEDQGALIRIRVGSGVYAYALDPSEVWRSWNSKKDLAAFTTRTLVRKSDRQNATIRRKLSVMIKEARGEPELPLLDEQE